MIRNFFRNLGYRFARFMYGRCGLDSLGNFLFISAIVCTLLSHIPYLWIFYFLSAALYIWEIFRFCSKNLYKRSAENMKYLGIINKLKSAFVTRKKIFAERKTHKYIKCKTCHQRLRLPRGRGKIEVICPKCHTKFITKT